MASPRRQVRIWRQGIQIACEITTSRSDDLRNQAKEAGKRGDKFKSLTAAVFMRSAPSTSVSVPSGILGGAPSPVPFRSASRRRGCKHVGQMRACDGECHRPSRILSRGRASCLSHPFTNNGKLCEQRLRLSARDLPNLNASHSDERVGVGFGRWRIAFLSTLGRLGTLNCVADPPRL
jgi:hypothetical protein